MLPYQLLICVDSLYSSTVCSVIEFDSETGGYYPILYLNTYWNLAQEYIPLNDSTK